MKRLIIALAATALLVGMTAPALGTGPDDVVDNNEFVTFEPMSDADLANGMPDVAPPKPGEINEAQLQDLATMAEEEGISLEAAIERYSWHESFSMLANEISHAYPDSFAGAMILADGEPWIAFESEVPTGAMALINDFETISFGDRRITVDVIEGRGFSEEELNAQLMEAHYTVLEQRSIVATAESWYDNESGAITIKVEPVVTPRNAAEEAALVAEIRSVAPSLLETVDFQVVDELGTRLEVTYVYGGHSQTAGTSAFTVKKGSTRGLATCGHCDPPNTYLPNITLINKGSHEGSWGDFRWNTVSSSYSPRDDFYSGPYHTNLRDVAGQGFPRVGQALCVNGKTSGKRCTAVDRVNVCNGSVCRLSATSGYVTAGGDSGAPWFYGNLGYGIHHAGSPAAGSLLSPIDYIDNALGVYLATYN